MRRRLLRRPGACRRDRIPQQRTAVAHVDAARGAVFDMLRAIPGLEFETCSAGTQVMAHSDVDDVEAFADFAWRWLILATSRNYSGMRS